MKRLRAFLAWLGFLLLVLPCLPGACEAQKPAILVLAWPEKAEIFPYSQPAIYDDWWHEIADCEGLALPADYAKVQFFAVNDSAFVPAALPLLSVYAVTFAAEDQIFISEPLIWTAHLIKHEMMHWILKRNGFDFGPWHPAEFFTRCGLAPWGK